MWRYFDVRITNLHNVTGMYQVCYDRYRLKHKITVHLCTFCINLWSVLFTMSALLEQFISSNEETDKVLCNITGVYTRNIPQIILFHIYCRITNFGG